MRKTDYVGIRIDPTITKKLNKVARLYHVRKSTIIRDLLAACDALYPVLKAGQDTTLLEERAQESLKGRVPNNLDPAMVAMIGEMINRIMTRVAEQLVAGEEGAELKK